MSTVSRLLRDVREFVDSAVRYGLAEPNSVGVTRWGYVDVQVNGADIGAWASYCDDAEVAANAFGTIDEFTFTDDDGLELHVYSGRRAEVSA